jgi:6-phosphogluconolactonase
VSSEFGEVARMSRRARSALALLPPLFAACGGDDSSGPVTLGGTVSGLSGTGLVLSDNNYSNIAISQNGTFAFPTPLSAGAGYSVKVVTQPRNPTQVCDVANGSGTVSGGTVTDITVSCQTLNGFLYAITGAGTVQSWWIDAGSGALTAAAPSAVPIGEFGDYVLPLPSALYAYVIPAPVGSGSESVYGYSIDAWTAGWSAVAGSPLTLASSAAPVLSRDGSLMAFYEDNVTLYLVNSSTGALSQAAGTPLPFPEVNSSAFSPSSTSFYVSTPSGIYGYGVNAPLGSLSAFAGNPSPAPAMTMMAFRPDGRFLYGLAGAPGSSAEIVAYSVNPSSGALTAVPGSPFSPGNFPTALAFDPTGTFLYVTADGYVDVYGSDPFSGSLSAVAGSPFAVSFQSFSLCPGGRYATAQTNHQQFALYSIDASSGALARISSALLPDSGWVTCASASSSAFANYVYVQNTTTGAVTGLSIDATTGALSTVGGSPYAASPAVYFFADQP